MATFHVSVFGSAGSYFTPDMNGYVGTSSAEVSRLEWGERITKSLASSIARGNAAAMKKANAEMKRFRG